MLKLIFSRSAVWGMGNISSKWTFEIWDSFSTYQWSQSGTRTSRHLWTVRITPSLQLKREQRTYQLVQILLVKELSFLGMSFCYSLFNFIKFCLQRGHAQRPLWGPFFIIIIFILRHTVCHWDAQKWVWYLCILSRGIFNYPQPQHHLDNCFLQGIESGVGEESAEQPSLETKCRQKFIFHCWSCQ